MHGPQVALVRSTSLTETEQALYDLLCDVLPPTCRIWRGVQLSVMSEQRFYECDLLVLGHYALYVVEVKAFTPAHGTAHLDAAVSQVRRLAKFMVQVIGEDLGDRRPWIEPVVVLTGIVPERITRLERPSVLTPAELVRVAETGDLPGAPRPLHQDPIPPEIAEDITRILESPGARSFQISRRNALTRLRQRIALESRGTDTPEFSEERAAAWIVFVCIFLVVEARGWLPGTPTTETARLEALEVFARLPAMEALLPPGHGLPASSTPITRVLLATLESVVYSALDEWHSSATAWPDLYETLLSEDQRERYGAISTPTFVAEFLCERTVNPAVATFGAEAVHVLDPACGAGTLLCAAYHRLVDLGVPALNALERVHGLDISPIAVAIARARLFVAHCERTVEPRLDRQPTPSIRIVAADALLTAPPRRYHVVLSEPPFIVGKDAALNLRYRELYPNSAHGQFAMTAPFIERCFQLAEPDGFVGLLTSNSFLQREFGRLLVETVLADLDIGPVIDTSNAFLPGHGTPTLLLFGRNRPPTSDMVSIVSPKKGESTPPTEPAKGIVWRAITAHATDPKYENEWLTVGRLPRAHLHRHPVRLSIGTSRSILDALDAASHATLRTICHAVRHGARSGADEVFTLTPALIERSQIEPQFIRHYIQGSSFRPWICRPKLVALALELLEDHTDHLASTRAWRFLSRFRPLLAQRTPLGRRPGDWWRWSRWVGGTNEAWPRILAPMLARTPDFVPAPDGAVIGATTIILELSSRDDDERQAVLAYLNSTAARFWLHQTCHRRGAHVELVPSLLDGLPLPDAVLRPGTTRTALARLARRLHADARALTSCSPEQILADGQNDGRAALLDRLADAQATERKLLRRIVYAQEEIDWTIYTLLDIHDESERVDAGEALPEHRPFAWRTNKPPPTLDRKLLGAWQRRREAITTDPRLLTLEADPYKTRFDRLVESAEEPELSADTDPPLRRPDRRRSPTDSFRQRIARAASGRLLRLVEKLFAVQARPGPLSVEELAALLMGSMHSQAVVSLSTSSARKDPIAILSALLADNSTPYLSALRYTRSGIAKRAAWERWWHATDEMFVAPRFAADDFSTAIVWQLRGRLDQEHESFIAYPAAAFGGPVTFGWTGWSTNTRAAVLWSLFTVRRDAGEGRTTLAPLLAGLHDLMVGFPAPDNLDGLATSIAVEARRLDISCDELHSFRPTATGP